MVMSSSSLVLDYGCNICCDLPVIGRRHLHLVGDGDYVGVTLPETNMAPENWWLEDESPFKGLTYFQGRAVSFREGKGSDGFVMFCELQAVGGNLYDIAMAHVVIVAKSIWAQSAGARHPTATGA